MPFDAEGKPYEVVSHELALEHDLKGDTKVDALGHLTGGRSFRIRTFVLSSRDNKLFMLANEAARCVGLTDSYSLFRRHPRLYPVKLTADDHSEYAGQDAVTARSIFLEFGALVIVGGRRVADDYYENDAQQKYPYGELVDPQDRLPPPGEPYNVEQWANGVIPPIPQAVQNELWLYDNASAVSKYNTFLNRQRAKLWTSKGVYEPHTGVQFYAKDSQPRNPRWTHRKTKGRGVVISTVISSRDRIAKTGLAKVDPKVYEGVSDDIKRAIEEQVKIEASGH